MSEAKARYRGVIPEELEYLLHYAGADTSDFLVCESPVEVRVQTLEQVALFGWYARGQVFGDLLVEDMTVVEVEGEYHLTFHGVVMVDPYEGCEHLFEEV